MILQSQVPTQLFKEWLQGLKGGVLDQRTWSPRVTPLFRVWVAVARAVWWSHVYDDTKDSWLLWRHLAGYLSPKPAQTHIYLPFQNKSLNWEGKTLIH